MIQRLAPLMTREEPAASPLSADPPATHPHPLKGTFAMTPRFFLSIAVVAAYGAHLAPPTDS